MKKILVVDDSKMITMTFKNLIEEKLGFPCLTAATKKEAEELLYANLDDIELALLDLGLPDAPEGEVIDVVQEYDIPIIVLTGSVESEDKFREKRIIDYVIKEGAYSIYYTINIIKQILRNKDIKVLIADDSKVFLAKTAELLKRYKLQVFTAIDGAEALKIVKEHPDIKLVFTDYDMPKINGLQLTRELRKKYKKNELSIIVTSGTAADKSIQSKFLRYGANDFIHKGFSEEEFFTRLNSNLEIISLFEDIEEEMEKNKEKDKILFEQSKMIAIDEVLGNIAHHWRQPLSVISTVASGLAAKKEMGIEDKGEEISSLSNIVTTTQELSTTIENFKNFFNTSNEKMQFSVSKLLEEYMGLVRRSFEDENIALELTCEDGLELFNSRDDFKQIIINLFANSKEAILENKCDIGVISIDAKKEDENIVIRFKDNAGGIDDAIQGKIFEPYFTTKHQDYGTGLGLYIIRDIIQKQFGGNISVSNAEFNYKGQSFKGAQFVLTMPLEIKS